MKPDKKKSNSAGKKSQSGNQRKSTDINTASDNNIPGELLWNLVESLPLNVSIWNKGKVLYANSSFYDTYGIARGDLTALNLLVENEGYVTIHPDDFDYSHENTTKVKEDVDKGIVFHKELRMKSHKDTDYRWFNTYVVKGRQPGSDITIEVDEDIDNSKTILGKLENALKEKDLLIKEVHHRVKNNFQVILSLIKLQKMRLNGKSAEDVIDEILSRVTSMSMALDKLYKSADLVNISFKEHVRDLVSNLSNIYARPVSPVRINLDIDDLMLSIDTAIPLTLVINEVLSNCIKHAVNSSGDTVVTISFKKSGNDYMLIIKDNGQGFPDGINANEESTLGLLIVDTLVNQISGELKLSNDNGAQTEIKFRV